MFEDRADRIARCFLSPSREDVIRAFRRSLWIPDNHFSILNEFQQFLHHLVSDDILPLFRFGCFVRRALREFSLSGISREFAEALLRCMENYFTTPPSQSKGIEEESIRALWRVTCDLPSSQRIIEFKEMPEERQYVPEHGFNINLSSNAQEASTINSPNATLSVKDFLINVEKEFALKDMKRIVEWYRGEYAQGSPETEKVALPVENADIFDDLFCFSA